MQKLTFKLEQFEGPLDLILHLVSKHKLNIYDIEISSLLEQYMAYMKALEENNLEVSSEFLEMAARLVYIKTVMLLPKHENETDELKKELTGRLLEYQMCKLACERLRQKSGGFDRFVRSPQPLPADNTYHQRHMPLEIYTAYQDAIGKKTRRMPVPVSAFRGIVGRKVVSVPSKIIFILKKLYRKNTVALQDIFQENKTKSELVATFLGLLELAKAKRVMISEDNRTICLIRDKTKTG